MLVAALLGCVALTGCGPPADPDEFSVILVTLDTTRVDRIGAYGGTAVPTPNLDSIAKEGVMFDSAISQVPLTLPAHSSILTGRYPASHGVRHNGIYRLREEEETLAEKLGAAGFDTAAFVSAFVLNSGFGTEQGFKTYDDIPVERYAGGRDQLYESQRTAEEVNASVFDWFDGREDGRFFLWIHYYDPHVPYGPPESPDRKLSGAGYDREISYLDSCFGDLLDRLRRDEQLDKTVLMVVGDHGEALGEHREKTHGVFLYDSSMRVPMMIRAPGLIDDGETVEGPVQIMDLAPTVLDLLDLEPLAGAQGKSLLPRISGEEEHWGSLAFGESFMPRLEFGWSELRMVRDSRYKYIQAPRPELYDIKEDPGELHNLLSTEAEVASEMAAMLTEWIAETSSEENEADARNQLSPQEEEKLRSLGYLGGGAQNGLLDTSGVRADPKDKIDEGVSLFQARDQLLAGQPEPALKVLEDILRSTPQNHLALTSKVQALVQLKRLPEAEVAAIEAVAAASTDPDASDLLLERTRRVLASVYWMLGKNEEAEREYRMAVELSQSSESAPVFQGILLGAAGGMQEAKRIIADVLERNPRDGMALAARFELEFSSEDREAALATAEILAEVREGDAPTLMKAGLLLRRAGKLAEALALFETADTKDPLNPDILGHLGTTRLALGDWQEAETALMEVRRLRPEDPRTPFYLGNIALLRNDETGARAFYTESLELDKTFIAPLLNLAQWMNEKQRSDEAVQLVKDALARTPDDERALQLLRTLQAG